MTALVRFFAAVATFLAVYFFVYWVPFSLISPDAPGALVGLTSLICALLAARWVWRTTESMSGGWISSVMCGAIVVGAVGFIGGFFGPLILAPGANQGPLLGIFITGPLGFIAGGVGGFLYWLARRPRV